MIAIAIAGGVAALVGGILYGMHLAEKKRTEAVRELAGRMSWKFEENPLVPGPLAGLEPFASGRRHRIRNRVIREREGDWVSAFDLHYMVQAGKHAKHYGQTLAEVAVPSGMPAFVVRPEHFGHRIAGALGMQDLDFAEYPAFSKLFLLRGPDEGGIRSLFTPPVVEFFEAHPGVGAACTGTRLYLYYSDRLAPPEELETRLEMIRELRRRLVGDAAAS